jgi:hypothetical protein
MALPRYKTLMAGTTSRLSSVVASIASGSGSPRHQRTTQPSSGPKQAAPSTWVRQGAARCRPSLSHSRNACRTVCQPPSARSAATTAVRHALWARSVPYTHSARPRRSAGRRSASRSANSAVICEHAVGKRTPHLGHSG